MLIEKSQIAETLLPIAGLKAHLKLGSAFDVDTVQDDMLAGFLRAAITAVEHRIGKTLLIRGFEWRPMEIVNELILPIAQLIAVEKIETWGSDGVPVSVPSSLYRVERTAIDTVVHCPFSRLDTVQGVSIHVLAGIADRWDQLPADLAQAVMMLAAHYYEFRNETGLSEGCMPFGVHSLLQRYRTFRVTMGRAV